MDSCRDPDWFICLKEPHLYPCIYYSAACMQVGSLALIVVSSKCWCSIAYLLSLTFIISLFFYPVPYSCWHSHWTNQLSLLNHLDYLFSSPFNVQGNYPVDSVLQIVLHSFPFSKSVSSYFILFELSNLGPQAPHGDYVWRNSSPKENWNQKKF